MGHVVKRGATGVRGSDQRADAGAGDEIDGDFVFFEHAQDADVGDAARESAAEGDAYFRAFAGADRQRPAGRGSPCRSIWW